MRSIYMMIRGIKKIWETRICDVWGHENERSIHRDTSDAARRDGEPERKYHQYSGGMHACMHLHFFKAIYHICAAYLAITMQRATTIIDAMWCDVMLGLILHFMG